MNSTVSSSATDQSKIAKFIILKKIRDQKEVLFGKFSGNLKKVDKEKAWHDIANYALKLGHFPHNRNGTYLRDTTWQNWRKRFVEKREKRLECERAGIPLVAKKLEFDEADLIISDILEGREDYNPYPRLRERTQSNQNPNNTYSNGNNVQDFLEIDIKDEDQYSGDYSSGDYVENEEDTTAGESGYGLIVSGALDEDGGHVEDDTGREFYPTSSHENSLDISTTYHLNTLLPEINNTTKMIKKRRNSSDKNLEENFLQEENHLPVETLKHKKLCLEVELLELEKYKQRLEVLKLEKSLGLSPSKITKDLIPPSQKSND